MPNLLPLCKITLVYCWKWLVPTVYSRASILLL